MCSSSELVTSESVSESEEPSGVRGRWGAWPLLTWPTKRTGNGQRAARSSEATAGAAHPPPPSQLR